MDWTTHVAVHESASPDFVREELLRWLKDGRIHPWLLYAGLRQATLWTELHHALSPAQRDESCLKIYDDAFVAAARNVSGNVAHVISLACGDGSKDVRLLTEFRTSKRAALYTPVDISLDLALAASRRSVAEYPGLQCTPLLCDLPRCSVLPAILKGFDPSGAERVLLFLGTIHNFWPPEILRSLLYPLRAQDQLLISANLAPEEAYDEMLQKILAQYDNLPTRRWLLGALSELGLAEDDGELRFAIEPSPEPGLKRIEATFRLTRETRVKILERSILFHSGQALSVFFSHRFTPRNLGKFLSDAGLMISDTWIGAGGQEGLFLCRRAGA